MTPFVWAVRAHSQNGQLQWGRPPEQLSSQLQNSLISLASEHGLDYERILLCQRYSVGHSPTLADNTLYIRLYPSGTTNWVPILDDMITASRRIGFAGRIEMVDIRAAGGIKFYPPEVSEQLQQEWPVIKHNIIAQLSVHHVDWNIIALMKRGYWEEAAVLTVVIKASLLSRALAATLREYRTQRRSRLSCSIRYAMGYVWPRHYQRIHT